MPILSHTDSGIEIVPSGFPVPRSFSGYGWLWFTKDAGVLTPPACDGKNDHTDGGEVNVAILQTLVPMAVEGMPVEERVHHVNVGKIEVYQFLCKVWRWETIPDRGKISRIRQMDPFPIQFPLAN